MARILIIVVVVIVIFEKHEILQNENIFIKNGIFPLIIII